MFGVQKDAAAFAASMKLMDLVDRGIIIRAQDQRKLIGFVPFGKRLVNMGSQAPATIERKPAFDILYFVIQS